MVNFVAEVEQQLGTSLPADFRSRAYVRLQNAELFAYEDILQYSRDYDAPIGVIYIGTWYGGNFWMLDVRDTSPKYIDAPASAPDHPDEILGNTYAEFLEKIGATT